jgi:hypothetical protein
MLMRIACFCLALLCTPAHALLGPEDVVSGFYTTRLASQSSGTPSGRELAEFSIYLAPELVCLLGAALRYDESFLAANPDSKPPFAEGDLYSSSFEVPTRFTLGKLQQSKSGAMIPVHFYRDEEGKPDTQGWQDLVHLKLTRKRWLISDVEYKGNFSSGNKGRLFETLHDTLDASQTLADWNPREIDACTMDTVKPKAKAKNKAKPKAKAAVKAKK